MCGLLVQNAIRYGKDRSGFESIVLFCFDGFSEAGQTVLPATSSRLFRYQEAVTLK